MLQSTVTEPPLLQMCEQIDGMVEAAMQFVAPDRGQALSRKWLPRGNIPSDIPERRVLAMAADAMLLSADLLISLAAGSGTTAVDRLAKSRVFATDMDKASLAALRQANFRLLELEGAPDAGDAVARDVISAERVRVVGADLPPLPAGTPLFGRLARIGEGVCHPAGALTPLDPAAFAVARSHAAAGAHGSAASRWAEAVYAHVVRHGTLDVPGLNRPRAFLDDGYLDDDDGDGMGDEVNPVAALALAWAALDGPADADLLQRTRESASLPFILSALTGLAVSQRGGSAELASALERMLLVQMETVQRRERGGSATLTLEAIAQAVDQAVAAEDLPAGARAAFQSLRRRLAPVPSGSQADDPALERLMQRIQALRAKTVAHGCTEPEALAAAEKVAELLDRHGLSLSELEFQAQPCEGLGIATTRRRAAPIDSCVPAIAAFFDCRVWVERGAGAPLRYVFFGLRGDVAAAHYLYDLVEQAFETETAAFRAGALYQQMAGERRRASTSFQTGMAGGICAKLKGLREARAASQRSASGRDLVPVKASLVDAELSKLGLSFTSHAVGRRGMVLSDAYDAGQEAGTRFEVVGGIERTG